MFNNLRIPLVRENNSFNFIRLVCCIIVFYEHCIGLSNIDLPILNFSSYAVHVFFIVSGFWVTKSISKSENIKDYVMKRFSRIFPSYWFVIIFWAVSLSLFSTLSCKDYFTSIDFWKYIFWNCITLNFLHPNLPGVFEGQTLNGAVNGALWTIKIEVAFYVALPIILYFISLMNKIKLINKGKLQYTKIRDNLSVKILLILYLFSVILAAIIRFCVRNYGLSDSLTNQFPSLLCYFITGMILLFGYEWISRHFVCMIPAVVIVLLNYMSKRLNNYILLEVTDFFEPISLGIIILFLALHLNMFDFIGKKKDYSYLIYLWHFPVIRCMIEYGIFDRIPLLGIIIALGITFLFVLIYNKFESILRIEKREKK